MAETDSDASFESADEEVLDNPVVSTGDPDIVKQDGDLTIDADVVEEDKDKIVVPELVDLDKDSTDTQPTKKENITSTQDKDQCAKVVQCDPTEISNSEVIQSNKETLPSAINDETCALVKPKEEPKINTSMMTQDSHVESEKQDPPPQPEGSWGWGGWGQTFVSSAWKSSVSTLANQLGEGLTNVLETVESALDVPAPENLAKENSAMEKTASNDPDAKLLHDTANDSKDEGTSSAAKCEDATSEESSWWGYASGLTSSFQKTSKTLVHGGIDVLETIGKKTMDVLHEGDPGFEKTKSLLHGGKQDQPNLSAALREAQATYESNCQVSADLAEARESHFGALLESNQGLVHLEALEMLAGSCETRLHSRLGELSSGELRERKPRLLQVKLIFDKAVQEEDEERDEANDVGRPDVEVALADAWKRLRTISSVPSSSKVGNHMIEAREKFRLIDSKLEEEDAISKDVHKACMQQLAGMTAGTIESFHKTAETLVGKGELGQWEDLCSVLFEISKLNCDDTDVMCQEFIKLLEKKLQPDTKQEINGHLTNIYLEMGNSRSYVQDALQLFLPVVQLISLESKS